ncbi:MAG: TonB-dependent receptor [Candidatus Rokubacteria bacterium]|nr:TonB-dependent receptor [Candidatus Rokubacteria bacterium]
MVRMQWIGLLAVPMLAQAVLAQEVKKLEPVVITATKVEAPQERLGASVTVITEDELQSYNYDRIEDALRSVPGVEVQRSGTLGKATSVRIRGANPNQVQVLIDGMRVKSPTLGQFDFSDLSLDDVERIEIIRGPQSTLHGADAIGGVIHLITKKGTGPPAGALSVEGGSHQTFREQAATSGALGRLNFSLSGSRVDSRGQERTFNNDDADQTAFASRFGFDFPWNATATATGRYAKSTTDVPNQGFFPFDRDPDSQQQTEFSLFTLRYDQKVLPWWAVAARMGQLWNNQGFQDGPLPVSPVFGPDFAFNSQVNTRRREFELLSTWHLGRVNSVTLGLEHRNERGRIRGTLREEINTRSLFLQDELRLLDRLFLGGGVRFEDSDAFGGEWTPRLSLAFLLKETGTKLRGGYGKGFRAPTINDLFFPDLTGGFCPPFGNVNLQPERSKSWEAGADQTLWEHRVRLGFTYFRNTFRDLISIVSLPPFCAQAGNVGKARTEGLEFSTEFEPLDWLLFNVNYTFTDTETDDGLMRLEVPRVARHRWNAGVTVTPVPRLSFFVQSYVVSRQFETSVTPSRHNPGYHRIDAGGTWRLLQRSGILDGLDFTLRVQNLTDENYAEVLGFRALGFSALAGLRASFR